jgi:hypothetical protein
MSVARDNDPAALGQLARRFEAAAAEFPGVDAIVFYRPDKFREELKREARRIFVFPPDPRASEFESGVLQQLLERIREVGLLDRLTSSGIDAALRDSLRAAGIDAEHFERLYTFDDRAERRKRHDGERAAIRAEMAWENLIPPNSRLVKDEHGEEIWRYAVRGLTVTSTTICGNSILSAPCSPHCPTPARGGSKCWPKRPTVSSCVIPAAATRQHRVGSPTSRIVKSPSPGDVDQAKRV